jgi:hypothetical protein
MTKKYIDADAVTEIREIDEEYFDKLERNQGTEFAEGFSEGWMCACDKIVKIIPAAEVRHSWLEKPTELSESVCHLCRKSPKMIFGLLPDYCPYCGAIFDGNENEDAEILGK